MKKGKRQIHGLRWCAWSADRDAHPVKSKQGAIYHGLKFERAFTDYLRERSAGLLRVGGWIKFEDAAGWGFCSPDAVLQFKDEVVLFECKLGFTYRKAYKEMNTLYAPLLHQLYGGMPIKKVQVCRHLKPSAKHTTLVYSYEEMLRCPKTTMTWRWSP